MTPQTSQTDTNLQAELDRLTYSAYLLTLDPGKAFSAVAKAIDGSLEETNPNSDLLERTIELALEEVLFESGARWDGESCVALRTFRRHQLKGISIAAGSERQPHPSARFGFPHSLRSTSPAGIQD